MPYRDTVQALTERYETLERELRASRERTQSLEELRAQEAQIAAELAAVARKLAEMSNQRRQLPVLDNVAIASPCNASWDKMIGNGRVRFCGDCQKNVYNLSAMPREEAESLLAANSAGEMCVRLYRRADGTVLTQDCPVGQKRVRRRKIAFGIFGATAMTAAAFMSIIQHKALRPCSMDQHRMGAVAMPMVPPEPVKPQEVTPVVPPPAPTTTDDGFEMGQKASPGFHMGGPAAPQNSRDEK